MKRSNWKVSVEPFGPGNKEWKYLSEELPNHEHIKKLLYDTKHRLLSLKLLDDQQKQRHNTAKIIFRFRATFYDYTNNIAIHADGNFDSPKELIITKTSQQPPVTPAEFSEALEVLHEHKTIGKMIRQKKLRPYKAMPGVRSERLPDGRTTRIITLGLHPLDKSMENEIVGIDLLNRSVIRSDETFDGHSDSLKSLLFQFREDDFFFPVLPIYENNSQHCWISVMDNAQNEIWRMLLYRPSSSSGLNGSGIDLRFVDYKGRRVLYQAHLPILNVLYDGNIDEYRDQQHYEAGFDAVGSLFKDIFGNDVDGFMNCIQPPKTIFDTGTEGSFTGVAFYISPDNNLSLTTMMQAGWYRYYNSYTFFPDGTITPRVGFTTSSENPYASTKHRHHAYFRFDFDIGNEFWNNQVIEESRIFKIGLPFFEIMTTETSFLFEHKKYRNNFNYLFGPSVWKIMDGNNTYGYGLLPGPVDGSAYGDEYAQGDLWFLHYHGNELDDGVPGYELGGDAPTGVQLDNFLNNESIQDADVVIWYAVHFLHDPAQTKGENDFGPTLKPVNW
jgi:hypothetical protein